MMKSPPAFTFKGYLGVVDTFDCELNLMSGTVVGLRDVIHFEGTTLEDVKASFRNNLNAYLKMCKNDGVEPQKPKSGKFNIRIDPSVHLKMEMAAHASGESLNTWVARHLEKDAEADVSRLIGA